MFRLIVVLAALATINAQYLAPTLTTQNQNIYRSFGNLGQVSHHSKTIDTPFSSVSKSDIRVSNPGYASYGLASPYAHAVAPALAPAYAHGLAPAYARPALLQRPVAAAVPGVGLLGVAYSAAPTVAHMTYSNGLGINYAW